MLPQCKAQCSPFFYVKECEGAENGSVPSPTIENIGEEKTNTGVPNELTVDEKVGGLEIKERAGKMEVCLAEGLIEGEWVEEEVSLWEEDINEEGVRWFSSVVAEYDEKRKEV